jgi:hypothetical protein
VTLLDDLNALLQEHRRCGVMEGGVEEGAVDTVRLGAALMARIGEMTLLRSLPDAAMLQRRQGVLVDRGMALLVEPSPVGSASHSHRILSSSAVWLFGCSFG